MKKALFLGIILLFLLVVWNNFYPNQVVVGTYISNTTAPVLEGPATIDTLILHADGSYDNRTWGKGSYDIQGDAIHFTIRRRDGVMHYHTSLNRSYFLGKPKIQLDYDQGFYYFKVD
ncbi:MAG: hypothetical protein HRT65_16165 [Flavobacteriaceae bacterium]|nr:hypothetical protein [Flavobacteriaceae bacterium]